MSIYLKSKDLQGNITAKGHEKSIEVHHLNFEVNRAAQMTVGENYIRNPNKPDLSVVNFSKSIDSSSNTLFELACTGKVINQVQFSVNRTGQSLESYVEYILHNVMVTHFSNSSTDSNLPSENVSFTYSRLEIHYLGDGHSPMRSSYDLKQAALV
ncbi:MAG: hypothetical protein A3F17_03950 [Gammaproteobacteria bacterium RIFCSPHIGHO2_12_FULL_41_15]|nr:MAG: hypothetical protein A3F17_03950 [Gammaproteobacteria bacterium RIFCSPHIGHO2_12_FULL_41_15]